ncbi:MAG: bacteriohemerythrin, partial [Rhodoferax sp.]
LLIERVNTVLEAIAKGQSKELLSSALSDLSEYTRAHFGREEAEMQRIAYAETELHMAEHANLLRQVHELKAKLDAGEKINTMGLYNFLTRWVKSHILLVDMKLAAALKRAR